jgi:hypothetical protein
MKRTILISIVVCMMLTLTSCASSTWSYISDTNNAVWLKVEGNKRDMTYRMWMTTPANGVWGDAAAWGTYSVSNDNDVRSDHPMTVIRFHSTSGENGNIHALDSLKQNSKFLEILGAVSSTVKGAMNKALTSDMIELYIDEANGRAQFRSSVIPMNVGIDAERVSGRWR